MKATLQNVSGLEALLDTMRTRLLFANYAQRTIEEYVRSARDLGLYYKKDPAELEADQVYDYLVYLKDERGASWKTIHQKAYGLRYLYRKVLGLDAMVSAIPYPRREKHLPVVLSAHEVKLFFSSCDNQKHRCIFGMLYGTGLRLKELCHLKLSDIDSKRMQVRVEQGKGNKDRYTVLPAVLVPRLRAYYRLVRPEVYLFNGRKKGHTMSPASVQAALKKTLKQSGITKALTVHGLRHTFACHSLERGMDLLTLQKLLGHAHLSTTLEYLQVSNPPQGSLFSPLDRLFPMKKK